MLRASLLLCVISGTVTACAAKDPIRATAHELVELRAKADPLSAYCRSGQWTASAHRAAQDAAGCTQTSHVSARSGW